MQFNVSCNLEYEVSFPSTLILSVHAQSNPSQTVLAEKFSIEPRVKVELLPPDVNGNRFARLETGRKKQLSIAYEATVSHARRITSVFRVVVC